MMILFIFFIIFSYSVLNSIMVSNLFYYFILIKQIRNYKCTFENKKSIYISYLLFVILVLFSTISYAVTNNKFDFRQVFQLLFTIQYGIFLIKLDLDVKLIEKWIVKFSCVLSFFIIVMFFILGNDIGLDNLFTTERLWGDGVIPGWPNSTIIPLLFNLFILIKNKYSTFLILLTVVAIILTTSRGGLFGIAIISIYFFYNKYRNTKLGRYFLFFTIITIALVIQKVVSFIYAFSPSLEYRIGVTYDRFEIYYTTLEYLKLRPFIGFGGNSLDQLLPIYGNFSEMGIEWQHTHSWVLDILLRYGLIGLSLFTYFLFSVMKNIQNKDKKFMFLLLIILSFFQIYLRNFSILLLMYYLTIRTRENLLVSNSIIK